mmetsp:Transcript_3128/g.4813  ORF Transcript_3128/g.4813 Transcript_3128/m.4813 type:complete len:536 (-) Transcript_3128:120-1727(-)|eukprot:CAMPEP_0201733586 /NCGR_PEP_ID=MMETSP0593-20130828/32008_1 /ASSEMBLY_ACC=CAM_ASM_000672 /TAXON_ID=267983 /ORGANISM="Skeletonema japonicum, Strain CCMP2506" /LENGTH=535 /DNA_ID=CAMNT_0048226775 /DNA_START=45 /DNA_END=1652 /DNA_ORIENTATION=+
MTTINSGKQQKKLRISARAVLISTAVFCITLLITVNVTMLQNQQRAQPPISPTKQQQEEVVDDKPIPIGAAENSKSGAFHFIVSSDCTSYQRWETLTQLHSAQNVKQCGRFTWIVSGCLEEGSAHRGKGKGGANSDILTPTLLLAEVERHFPYFTVSHANETARTHQDCNELHPHVHFTPDYSDMRAFPGPFADGKSKRVFINKQGKHLTGSFGNKYKFNNKPNGLHHWIVNFLEHDSRRDETIILNDPDFLFLTKFDFPDGVQVVPGRPAAAKYGLGAQFLDFDLEQICQRSPLIEGQQKCPFQNLTSSEVHKHYNVGAPYAIHIQDVLPLSSRWKSLVPPTYDQYPLLYAEMFAYVMAAADLNLKHNLVRGLFTGCMTGNPKVKDDATKVALQKSASTYAKLIETNPTGQEATRGGASSCFLPPLTPPPFFHYCARYSFETPYHQKVGETNAENSSEVLYHFFYKRRVEHDVLDCADGTSSGGAVEPFLATEPQKKEGGNPDWNVLAVCVVVRAINLAKEMGCKGRNAKEDVT